VTPATIRHNFWSAGTTRTLTLTFWIASTDWRGLLAYCAKFQVIRIRSFRFIVLTYTLTHPHTYTHIVTEWSVYPRWRRTTRIIKVPYFLCPRPIRWYIKQRWPLFLRLSVYLSRTCLILNRERKGVGSWKMAGRKPMTRPWPNLEVERSNTWRGGQFWRHTPCVFYRDVNVQ